MKVVYMAGLLGGLSIANVEHLAKDLIDIYKTLNAYNLLPENFENYYQTTN